MTGHSTCVYSLVPVGVVRQQSWLTISSWRLACSLNDVLFGDALHCSLMTDCGGYMYFSYHYRSFFRSLLMYGAMFSYNQMFCFPFIKVYLVVNSYIVNKTFKCMEAQPPEIKLHKTEIEGLGRRDQRSRSQANTRGLYARRASEASSHE